MYRGEGSSFEMKRLRPMSLRMRTLLMMGALAAVPATPAVAQIAPLRTAPQAAPKSPPKTTAPRPAPDALAPNNPDFKPDVLVTQTPTPALPPAVWDPINAQDLLRYIAAVGKEGLNPADYDPAGL